MWRLCLQQAKDQANPMNIDEQRKLLHEERIIRILDAIRPKIYLVTLLYIALIFLDRDIGAQLAESLVRFTMSFLNITAEQGSDIVMKRLTVGVLVGIYVYLLVRCIIFSMQLKKLRPDFFHFSKGMRFDFVLPFYLAIIELFITTNDVIFTAVRAS